VSVEPVAESAPKPLLAAVAFHNTGDLRELLTSVGPNHDLLVVDNGGEDEVLELVQSYGGRYLRPGRNIGFAAAVNLALAQRAGRDVLLLNPDARITPDLPAQLAAALHADPRLAAVAPSLRFPSGAPQQVAWAVPSPREYWVDALGARRLFRPARTFLIGAVLLLRDAAITDVGLFDQRYFLYSEECDWQVEAMRRGWRVQQVESLWAEHAEGGSSEHGLVRDTHFHHSAELFARKWYGTAGWRVMKTASIVGAALRLAARAHSRPDRARYTRILGLYLRGTDRRVA
jgi:GT2 family glycosyltransferase